MIFRLGEVLCVWKNSSDHDFGIGLSLSQTSYGWQLNENQAILLWDEGSL